MKNFFSQRNVLNLLVVCLVMIILFLGNAYVNNRPFGDSEMAFAFGNSGNVSSLGQSCFKDYYNWTSSTVYDGNHDWNIDLVPVARVSSSSAAPNVFQMMQDINGDGLADFVFSYGKSGSYPGSEENYRCLALNNGAGWDIVYKCVHRGGRYYGDCAG